MNIHSRVTEKFSQELESDLKDLLINQWKNNLSEQKFARIKQRLVNVVLSSRVDYLKDFKSKEQRILYVRGQFVYFFTPGALLKKIKFKLSKIKKVSIIRRQSELLFIEVQNYHPYLLQSLFCYQIALFLSYQAKRLGLPPLVPSIKGGILLTKKGSFFNGLLPADEESKSLINESVLTKPNHSAPTKLQKLTDKFTVSNAIKRGIGWVCKKKRGHFGSKEWKQDILVLVSVGILIFDSMCDQWPFFYPVGKAVLQEINSQALPSFPKKMQLSFGGAKTTSDLAVLEIMSSDLAPLVIIFNSEHEREAWKASIKNIEAQRQLVELKALKLCRRF